MVTYSIQVKLGFEGEEVAETVFQAIYSDIKREKMRDVTIDLERSGSTITFTASSPSLAKFRGVVSTFMRLVRVSRELIRFCDALKEKGGGE